MLPVTEHLNGEGVQPYKIRLLADQALGRVLDAGSGVTQPYRAYLEQRASAYVSVDIRPGAMVQADLLALPFADRAFDLCWCSEVLEHVPDPQAVLDELRRVAAHGIVTFPTPRSLGFYADPGHREVVLAESWQEGQGIGDGIPKGAAILRW